MAKIEDDIKAFKGSPRHAHIKATQKMAKERGLCKELDEEGRCRYPHCNCLFGNDGPVQIIGVEYEQDR